MGTSSSSVRGTRRISDGTLICPSLHCSIHKKEYQEKVRPHHAPSSWPKKGAQEKRSKQGKAGSDKAVSSKRNTDDCRTDRAQKRHRQRSTAATAAPEKIKATKHLEHLSSKCALSQGTRSATSTGRTSYVVRVVAVEKKVLHPAPGGPSTPGVSYHFFFLRTRMRSVNQLN